MPIPREKVGAVAIKTLTPFLSASDPTAAMALTMGLAPRPEDYARVFAASVVDRAREGFGQLWSAPQPPLPKRGQTMLRVRVAFAEELANPASPFGAEFPGGYREVAALLAPGTAWVSWKFTTGTETAGMAYNGLVYLDGSEDLAVLDGRFAYFPKPYKVLAG